MLLEAIKRLNEWKAVNIQNYLIDLVEEPISKLRKAGFVIEDKEYRASNLFGIRLGDNHSMEKLKEKLDQANIFVSYRGDAIRVSPNVYNDFNDIETLVNTLIS
jgi:selenocysteine lyase/cysteine desulfurase